MKMKIKKNYFKKKKKHTLVPLIRRGAVVCTSVRCKKTQGTVDANGTYIYIILQSKYKEK